MKKILPFLALLISGAALAQNLLPIQDFQAHFGVDGENAFESAKKIIHTKDGNFILAGSWQNNEAFLMKVSSCGDSLWTKTFQFGTNTSFEDCIETASGDLIAVGTCEGCAASDVKPKVILLKTDATGQAQNNVVLGDSNVDAYGAALKQTSDGGVVLTGYSSLGGLAGHSVHLFKLDQNLNLQWKKYHDKLYFDHARDVIQTADGGYAITGNTFNFGEPEFVLTIKTDASGNLVWAKNFNLQPGITGVQNQGNALQQASNGNLLIAGTVYSDAIRFQDLFVAEIKIQSGDTLKVKTFGSEYDDVAYDLQVLNSGVLVAGTQGGWAGFSLAWVLQLDNALNIEKNQQFYFGGYASHAFSIIPLSPDGQEFALCGQRNYWGAGCDVTFVQRDRPGNKAVLTKFPFTLQLYPRDQSNNKGTVKIEGFVKNPNQPYTEMRLQVYRNGALILPVPVFPLVYSGDSAAFSFAYPIPAELADYDFDLSGIKAGVETIEACARKVVAGDAFIIQGQSNAVSVSATTANPINRSPYIRVYGSGNENGFKQAWFVGDGDGDAAADGNTGQWGLRMAKQIIDNQQIPVAILNGAHSGAEMNFFLPDNPNYGRLLQRVQEAGLYQKIRAAFWFQGETDAWLYPDLNNYKSKFATLHDAWMQDFNPEKTMLFQIRPQCFEGWGATLHNNLQIMEALRQLAGEIPDASIMSTTAVLHDGCHYPYEGGYETLGDRMYKLVAKDLYGATNTLNVEAPNVQSAAKVIGSSVLTLTMENAGDDLVWENGSEEDFILEGTTDSVLSGSASGNQLSLQLSGPAPGLSGISYAGHKFTADPFVTNANGVGMLCFYNFPVEALVGTQEVDGEEAFNMRLYPNPSFGGKVTMSLDLPQAGHLAVSIYNVLGQLVHSEMIKAGKGETTHVLEVPGSAGLYFVEVKGENGKGSSVKLVVR